jgi:hypothetical protein
MSSSTFSSSSCKSPCPMLFKKYIFQLQNSFENKTPHAVRCTKTPCAMTMQERKKRQFLNKQQLPKVFFKSNCPRTPLFLAASGARPALMIALLLLLLAFSSFSHLSLFVPCYGTFCAFPWHISLKSLFVLCYGTFCAFPGLISLKSLLVPCYGTFCALPWHIIR